MSRFVVTSSGSRVNLDRLDEITFRPDPSSTAAAAIVGRAGTDELEIIAGPEEAVRSIWARWPTLARDGMDLGRCLVLEVAKELGIDPGEISAGYVDVDELLRPPAAPEPDLPTGDTRP